MLIVECTIIDGTRMEGEPNNDTICKFSYV